VEVSVTFGRYIVFHFHFGIPSTVREDSVILPQSLTLSREPPILVHSDTYDDDSVSDTIAVEPTIVGLSCTHHIAAITALACYTNDELVFCGKDNGDITLYSTATGMEVQIMYQHAKGIAIKLIEYGTQSNVLASADASSRVMVWKVARTGKAWVAKGPLLDARIPDYAINQLLFDANNNWLLISTLISDIIYNVSSGIKKAVSMEKKSSRRWINHHHDPRKVICVTAEVAYIRSWEHLSDPDSAETKLVLNTNGPILVKDVAIHMNGCILSIELSGSSSQQSTFKILLLSASSFDKSFANTIEPVQRILSISQKMRHVIGSHGKKFLFLDPGMWVCSLDLETFESEYSRHCFIPNEWLSTNWDLMMKVNQKGDLIYVKGHELAIIKRALDNKVAVSMNTG